MNYLIELFHKKATGFLSIEIVLNNKGLEQPPIEWFTRGLFEQRWKYRFCFQKVSYSLGY